MSRFAERPKQERGLFILEAAARLGVMPVIVEKDYWVCWLLGRIFADPKWEPHLIFKGGTSLSKVFNAISRFSEDIDLSVSPAMLGHPEIELDEAPSKTMRQKRFKHLQTACADMVAGELQKDLELLVRSQLGEREQRPWFRYEVDSRTDTPNSTSCCKVRDGPMSKAPRNWLFASSGRRSARSTLMKGIPAGTK